MASLWKRRSIAVFFAVGFGLAWVGWTINAFGKTEPPLRTILFYFGDFMTVAGFVATWVAGGTPALKALLARCLRGGGALWWGYALLLPPLWIAAAQVAYGLRHGQIGAIDWSGLSLFVAAPAWRAFTTGPLGEEVGWRGYFLPRLLGRYQPVVASLVLGLLWAFWHYPLYIHSTFSTLPRAVNFTASVVCFTMLMTVLFHRTRGSILLAILFHWSVNVSPDVVERVIPVTGGPGFPVASWYTLASLAVTTVIVMALTGWSRLGAGADFVVERDLAAEAIDR